MKVHVLDVCYRRHDIVEANVEDNAMKRLQTFLAATACVQNHDPMPNVVLHFVTIRERHLLLACNLLLVVLKRNNDYSINYSSCIKGIL
jgi:hypothetical protein